MSDMKLQRVDFDDVCELVAKGWQDPDAFIAAVRERMTIEDVWHDNDPRDCHIQVVHGWGRWIPSANWSEFQQCLYKAEPCTPGAFHFTITNFSGDTTCYGDHVATGRPLRKLETAVS